MTSSSYEDQLLVTKVLSFIPWEHCHKQNAI